MLFEISRERLKNKAVCLGASGFPWHVFNEWARAEGTPSANSLQEIPTL